MSNAVANTLVHLIGLPGVGKLTIAKELATLLPAKLVDNHSVNNVILNLAPPQSGQPISEETWVEVRKVRTAMLEAIATLAPREHNYVFTNVLIEGDAHDEEVRQTIARTIARRDGHYVPVTLTCAKDEHKARFTQPERAKIHKMTRPEGFEKFYRDGDVAMRPTHAHALMLDVTALTPAQSAAAIANHCRMVCA